MDELGTLGLENLVLEKPAAPRSLSRVRKRKIKCAKKEASPLSHIKKASRQLDLPNEPSIAPRVTAVSFAQVRLSSAAPESTAQNPTLSVLKYRTTLSGLTSNIDIQRPTRHSITLNPSSMKSGQAHHQPTSERVHLDRADFSTLRASEISTSPYKPLANPHRPQTIRRTT